MKLDIPLEPHTASRPRWTDSGNITITRMPKGYREWRTQFNNWFVQYLEDTDNELLYYLTHLADGRPIMNVYTNPRTGKRVRKIVADFLGYSVTVINVIPRPAKSTRPFPFETKTADLDNYYKAVTDGVFESEAAKYIGINDRWIQEMKSQKRYTIAGTDEKPHIELTIKRIEAGGEYT